VIAEVSAVVAIIAAFIASLQVVVSRSTSRSEILRDAMRSHWSPDSVASRDIVYGLEKKNYDQWSADERDVASNVAIQISQVGFLLRNSYADRRSFLDFWAPWCVRCL
jgi:thiol:disulfide interchange protein